MRIRIVEAINNQDNWAKLLVGAFAQEWSRQSVISDSGLPLLAEIGHARNSP